MGVAMTLEDEAYRAIGLVVANSQFFEFAFLVCAKLTLAQNTLTDLADVNPLSISSFKQPTTAVLRELKTGVALDPGFEAKLDSVVQRRHEIVHRWLLKHGWPQGSDDPALRVVIQFANQLSIELNALTRLLVEAIAAWLEKFPETRGALNPLGGDWRANLPQEYRSLTIGRQ